MARKEEKLSIQEFQSFLGNMTQEQAKHLKKFLEIRKNIKDSDDTAAFYQIWETCLKIGIPELVLQRASTSFIKAESDSPKNKMTKTQLEKFIK